MPFRIGILDVVAAGMVTLLIAIPDRDIHVHDAYAEAAPSGVRDVAKYQALQAAAPGDGEIADAHARALLELHQSDWALRAAGAAAERGGSPTSWRAHFAVSTAHASRLEMEEAHGAAERALSACGAEDAECPEAWRARIALHRDQLERGLESGIDPQEDPDAFYRESMRLAPPPVGEGGP